MGVACIKPSTSQLSVVILRFPTTDGDERSSITTVEAASGRKSEEASRQRATLNYSISLSSEIGAESLGTSKVAIAESTCVERGPDIINDRCESVLIPFEFSS